MCTVGCYDGKVYGIERSSGIIKWSFQTEGPVKSSACVNPCNGFAYIGSHDHHLYAFDFQVLTVIVHKHLNIFHNTILILCSTDSLQWSTTSVDEDQRQCLHEVQSLQSILTV